MWSRKIRIPAWVRAGTCHFDFQAVDADFRGIYLKGTVQDGIGEQGSVAFTVKEQEVN
ncbi:MAG: hypothetical protein JSU63_19715 [Phycisphaerales bacterium]|nr:MAG: hypothetical protein JSU63_19715 [Phycisphaerales bacterium]